jgi:hypothetical protein
VFATRAGRARETGEIFRQSAEAKAEAEENAAVLEILKKKNGAFANFFYLKQKKLLKKEAELSLKKLSPN